MDNTVNNNVHYLNKLHQDILIIMDEINRICIKNKLRYYLMCGTCLGAVRHKGFIPWDDDLDIAMPRSDFNRFITLLSAQNSPDNCERVLGEGFYLRWVTTESKYNLPYAKVCLNGTRFQEKGTISLNAGIFVDVFPLDSCESFGKKIQLKSRILSALNNCLFMKGVESPRFEWNIRRMSVIAISRLLSNRTIHKLMVKVIKPLDEGNSQYQAIFVSPYPINRMFFPKEWHGEGRELLFEGRRYKCPIECDKYLQVIYGKDYMQLPPVNKRKSHYPYRVVFSDGEEMLFDIPEQIVDYQDVLDS